MHLTTQSLKDVFQGCLKLNYNPNLYAFIIIPPDDLDAIGGIKALIELHHLSGERLCIIAPFVCLREKLNLRGSMRIGTIDDWLVQSTEAVLHNKPSAMKFHREEARAFLRNWHEQNYEFLRMLRVPTSAMPCIIVCEQLDTPKRVLYKSNVNLISNFRRASDLLWERCGWHAKNERKRLLYRINAFKADLERAPAPTDITEYWELQNAKRDDGGSSKRRNSCLRQAVIHLKTLRNCVQTNVIPNLEGKLSEKMQRFCEEADAISDPPNPTEMLSLYDMMRLLRKSRLRSDLPEEVFSQLTAAYTPFNVACEGIRGNSPDKHVGTIAALQMRFEHAWEKYLTTEFPAKQKMIGQELATAEQRIQRLNGELARAQSPTDVLRGDGWICLYEESGQQEEPVSVVFNAMPNTFHPTYAVSYSWKEQSKETVERLCREAEVRGIRILRDVADVGLGEKLSKFMTALAGQNRVFVILSDAYLRSENCMFELSEIWRLCQQDDAKFHERVRVFRLPDARIYDMAYQLDIIEHWEEEYQKVHARVSALTGRGTLSQTMLRRFNNLKAFAQRVAEIMPGIADRLLPKDFEEFALYGFEDNSSASGPASSSVKFSPAATPQPPPPIPMKKQP